MKWNIDCILPVGTKHVCVQERQPTNWVISLVLHISQMLLYLHFKPALHNIKMNNSDISANIFQL